MPDIEVIIKLLRSDNSDDNQLGYEYLAAQCNNSVTEMNILLEETNIRIVDTSMLSGFSGNWISIRTANMGDKIKFLNK